jgi:hypothetical protein
MAVAKAKSFYCYLALNYMEMSEFRSIAALVESSSSWRVVCSNFNLRFS